MNPRQYIALVSLHAFLAITALAGGTALLLGFQTPPLALLDASPFKSYLVPGLALAVVVGGSASVTAVMLFLRHPRAILPSLATGVAVLVFEAVEIAVIGSPAGPARAMQILYIVIGIAIGVLSLFLKKWPSDRAHP